MDPTSRAVSAYGDASSAAKSPRQVEYQAFAKITNALTRSAARDDGPEKTAAPSGKDFVELAEALHENLRLWTIVQGDVSTDGNGLPDTAAGPGHQGDFVSCLLSHSQFLCLLAIRRRVQRGRIPARQGIR